MRKKKGAPEKVVEKSVTPPNIGGQLGAALRDAGLQKLKSAAKAESKSAKAAPAKPSAQVKAGAAATPTATPTTKPPLAVTTAAPRPRSKYTAGELAALGDAYRGVRPIARAPKPTRVTAAPKIPAIDLQALEADRQARERLGALIGGGVRFEMSVERDGYVQAIRQGASRKSLALVQGSGFAPETTLDLHGQRAADAASHVHDFVRSEHRKGARKLLIIVGKGTHSEGGVGVLGGIAREALSRGGAAPLVQAFASAHETLGGRGALAVLLR